MKLTGAAVREAVQDKIAKGILPRDRSGAVVATFGASEVCDACSASVAPEHVLYTLRRVRDRFLFHVECFGIWRDERNRTISAEAAVPG